jgi:hypothetical protein
MSSYEDRKREAEIQAEAARKNPVRGRIWTPHWSHYWEPPEGSTYGSDPYLCSDCADRDAKEVPAVIRVADISGSHHAGTDAVLVKTESGWEMTEPIEEYTIADIKDAAENRYAEKTGYCKDCWIKEMGGAGNAANVMNKKLFGAESSGDFMVTKEADWSEFQDTYAKAVILIDNSGSTAAEDTGVIDRETGHYLNRLDRHVLTAATYLGAFPDSGDYRIITCVGPRGSQPGVEDFDNTDDAIEYLFALRPHGNSFSFRNDIIAKQVAGYGNVLLIQDEDLAPLLRNQK